MLEKIIALDIGTRWIGIAISNSDKTLAFPHCVTEKINLKKVLNKIFNEEKITLIIYGLPLTPSGKIGEQALETEKIINDLKNSFKDFDLSWKSFDERYSSYSATQILLQHSQKSKSNQKKREDAIAAALMLESFLNHERNINK